MNDDEKRLLQFLFVGAVTGCAFFAVLTILVMFAF